MKHRLMITSFIFVCFACNANTTSNQTDELSPVLPQIGLPFQVTIEQASFQLPIGLHSGMVGSYKGQWVFIAGRNNGLHGFPPTPPPDSPPAFPTSGQNINILVVDPKTGQTFSRSLNDPTAGLTAQQIESLSVTSPQGYQSSNTLYMTGGYGYNSSTGSLDTKPILTAIYLPGIVKWVMNPTVGNSVGKNIRQLYNPVFQIAGGEMFPLGNLTQLVFGQNFTGYYYDPGTGPGTTGVYSEQVRQFQIVDANGQLAVNVYPSRPSNPDPNLHRRDLNIVPVILDNNANQYGLVAYAGVFYPYTNPVSPGVWTVPVLIQETGNPIMADPNAATTFKQAMNQYVGATASLYSKKDKSNYTIIFGGMSYGYYQNDTFQTDPEIPFLNQVTTIKMDQNGSFTQYLMDSQYPTILASTLNLTHPSNPLLFGAGAYFIPSNLLQYPNKVISLDAIRKPTVLGYIVGGIASSLPDTNTPETDSQASPYVFKVTLTPNA